MRKPGPKTTGSKSTPPRKTGARAKRTATPTPAVAEAPAPPVVEPPEAAADAEEPAILQRLDATPKWSAAIVAGGLMLVAGLSVFAIRGITRRK